MSKLNHQDDLDLLLSLEDRVQETPPGSPSGYLSDDGFPKQMGNVDMSVFRDIVQDCLDYDPQNAEKPQKSNSEKSSGDIEVEKFSKLRIRNQVVSRIELSNHLSDIRFIQLPAIKNMLVGDTLSGCWATIGVLSEKGAPRESSIGKKFVIWKMGCLDEDTISLFLFGDAYKKCCEEKIGAVFALFNCSVRKDKSEKGFSLSVYQSKHIMKLGTSADFGFCQSKGKDGEPCRAVINKRQLKHCSYHRHNTEKKYTSARSELSGGNLRTGFRNYLKSEGIYMVKPAANKPNLKNSAPPVKLLSVDGLKRALSKADKVTTNLHSQGIRFLSHVSGGGLSYNSGTTGPKLKNGAAANNRLAPSEPPVAKKLKVEKRQSGDTVQDPRIGVKMIELDFVSSDEEH